MDKKDKKPHRRKVYKVQTDEVCRWGEFATDKQYQLLQWRRDKNEWVEGRASLLFRLKKCKYLRVNGKITAEPIPGRDGLMWEIYFTPTSLTRMQHVLELVS